MHVYHYTVKRVGETLSASQRGVRQARHWLCVGRSVDVDAAMTEDEDKGAGLGVQVIARAASVLSLGQIAKEVGLARSTVQRIVAALANEDFVAEAQPGRGVRIGPGLARIAQSLSSNLTEILHQHLVALRDEVGETVDLSILSGGSAVFVDQIPGQRRLVALSGIGERFPLHCTANGKAILACFAKEDATILIRKSVAEHRDHPLKDEAKLLRELDAVRRKHLAFDLGEHGEGISAVGVAMLDPFGRPVAVSIPAPTHRFDAQREQLSATLAAFRVKMGAIIGE
jgi:DNA-binding IclR family transcriptional regulator